MKRTNTLKDLGDGFFISPKGNLMIKVDNSNMFKPYNPPSSKPKGIIGIYGIYDTIRDMWYIGSSINVVERLETHKAKFRTRRRHGCRLMYLMNPCHDNNMRYMLLETCKEEDLSELERYYIRLADSFNNGYNQTYSTGRK